MTVMPTTLREDAEKFAQFIVANYPDAKEWTDPVRQAAWYISYGFVASVINDDGEIVALLAARPVERPGLGVLPYYFNEHGTNLHVDMLIDISTDKKAMSVLEAFAKLRWPQCTTIAMFRHYEEHLCTYSLKKFWPRFHKLKRIQKKKNETVTVAS
jgi:hypothetical protein